MLLCASLATPVPDTAALIADGVAEPPDAWIQMRSDGVVPVAWIQAWLRRPSQDSDFLSNATQMRVTPGQVEAESVDMGPQLSIMAGRANKARECLPMRRAAAARVALLLASVTPLFLYRNSAGREQRP